MTSRKMSKDEIKLRKEIDDRLDFPDEQRAELLLDGFIEAFKRRDKVKKSKKWWKKIYYNLRFAKIVFPGYILDIKVNRTIGRKWFGAFAKYPKLGTLTATLKRVKKSVPLDYGQYYHHKYGYISEDLYNLAVLICKVLSEHDEDHC